MAFDFKKEYREFYLPEAQPEIVTVPPVRYCAVRGTGDPNEEGGAYKKSISLLYGVAFTVKMSKKNGHQIKGYFEYVVPPLEGFWWQEGRKRFDYSRKDTFHWISVIRLPDFVGEEDFRWAVTEVGKKKKHDVSAIELLTVDEGICVQMLHIGSFDTEPVSVAQMDAFIAQQGYENDFSDTRWHHEIYLSDARRVPPDRWRTIIRHPIRKITSTSIKTK